MDTARFEREMRGFERQIPFAMARALTRTAKDGQEALRAKLSEHFTLRSSWLIRGLRIEPARKDTLVARVGSVDPFMEPQAVGGPRAKRGAEQFIPLIGRGKPRPTEQATTRPSRWPGALLKKTATFLGVPKSRPDAPRGVWQGVTKRTNKRGMERFLRLLYLAVPEAKIPAIWPIREEVEHVVATRWEHHQVEAIRDAIETAR